jgi:CBS domain-containing protein
MKCAEIMKADVECSMEGETVQEAARRMRDHKIGFLPVCNAAHEVIGTLTDRDLATRVVAEGRSPQSCPVEDVMTREAIACRPDDDLSLAEQLMGRFKKSRILITDDDGSLAGVISLSDIAERESPDVVAATLREVVGREARA